MIVVALPHATCVVMVQLDWKEGSSVQASPVSAHIEPQYSVFQTSVNATHAHGVMLPALLEIRYRKRYVQ
jgi:hypothetical protein